MKALDLFCGCGGLSVGLQMAGVEVIGGIDVEPKYLSTYAHNFGEYKSHKIDLSRISPILVMEMLGLKRGELDILVGGPPCQGFSKNVPRKSRSIASSNNLQVKIFIGYCIALRPKIVLMENVAEMKNGFDKAYSRELINSLELEGYSVTPIILNAADYGIPQRRRRAFFLANRIGDQFISPKPTHFPGNHQNDSQLSLLSPDHQVTVWEAIGDLPSLLHGEGKFECQYASDPFSEFQRMMRSETHRTVRNHVARKLAPIQYKRLSSLMPGQALKDLPPELQVKGGYSGAYGRLTKDMISPTITRWVFHPGSGRWGHPVDIRTLTIREVARIQSFPDYFEFVGSYNDQAGQLGNAVPPLLCKKIVESMLSQLSQSISPNNFTNSSRDIFSSVEGA